MHLLAILQRLLGLLLELRLVDHARSLRVVLNGEHGAAGAAHAARKLAAWLVEVGDHSLRAAAPVDQLVHLGHRKLLRLEDPEPADCISFVISDSYGLRSRPGCHGCDHR